MRNRALAHAPASRPALLRVRLSFLRPCCDQLSISSESSRWHATSPPPPSLQSLKPPSHFGPHHSKPLRIAFRIPRSQGDRARDAQHFKRDSLAPSSRALRATVYYGRASTPHSANWPAWPAPEFHPRLSGSVSGLSFRPRHTTKQRVKFRACGYKFSSIAFCFCGRFRSAANLGKGDPAANYERVYDSPEGPQLCQLEPLGAPEMENTTYCEVSRVQVESPIPTYTCCRHPLLCKRRPFV